MLLFKDVVVGILVAWFALKVRSLQLWRPASPSQIDNSISPNNTNHNTISKYTGSEFLRFPPILAKQQSVTTQTYLLASNLHCFVRIYVTICMLWFYNKIIIRLNVHSAMFMCSINSNVLLSQNVQSYILDSQMFLLSFYLQTFDFRQGTWLWSL